MANNIIKKNDTGLLPKELERMTLGDLLQDEDAKVIKKKNKLKVSKKVNNNVLSFEVSKYDVGHRTSSSRFEKPEKVKDLKRTIERMYYEDKMTQSDIAFELGISQTSVSNVLNNK